MRLERKVILLISPEGWGLSHVSKHHYALALARRGNRVFFLNPPASSFATQELEEGLVAVDYKPLFRGLGRLPAWFSSWLTWWELRRLEGLLRVTFDVIWNFDSSRFFSLSKVPDKVLKICHLVDLNQNIHRSLLASTSNLCLGTTRYIVAALQASNTIAYQIGHAYQLPGQAYEDFHFEMPGANPQKALYLGNLSMKYIDWHTLLRSAIAYPGIDFVMVGPDGKSNLSAGDSVSPEKESIRALPNTFFCPPVHSRFIPQLLQMADVLLVVYGEEFHKDQAAPHKMLEYLASGKPIVATYTEEFDVPDYNGQLFMSRKNEDFVGLLSRAIAFGRSADAQISTYQSRLKEIEKLITWGQ